MRTKPHSLKSDKRYKDAPRFKAIYGYEDRFKAGYEKTLKEMNMNVVNKLKSQLKLK